MYRFDEFELDTERFELRQNGQQVPVEPRVFDFLNLLIENHERVIDRDEIIEKLWDGRFVSEAAISTCVKNARRALGDDGKAQTLIKTVHGKGFRFTGTLTGNQTPSAQPRSNTSELPSLIILPFQVFGDDPALQASADGLVETLTTVLTRIPMLSIVSRTASFALKGQPIVIDEIKQRFGAWYMLEGSLQTGANGVRVNVQLIETATGHHIWARRIDQPASPGLVDDLVAQLIPVLEPQLVRAMMKGLDRKTGERSAQSLTLEAMGVLSLKGWTRASFEESASLLHKALDKDPELPLAHAYLALVLGLGHRVGILEDRDTLIPKVTETAAKAIALDRMDSTVLGMSGCALADIGEHDQAVHILNNALDINPDNAQARTALGTVQLLTGQFVDAAANIKTGIDGSPLDPRRAIWGTALAMANLLTGKTEEAVNVINKACQADDQNHIPQVVRAAVEIWQNRKDEAETALITALKLRPDLSDREVKALVGKGFYASLEPCLENARSAVAIN